MSCLYILYKEEENIDSLVTKEKLNILLCVAISINVVYANTQLIHLDPDRTMSIISAPSTLHRIISYKKNATASPFQREADPALN
jgi:hypothetical protein